MRMPRTSAAARSASSGVAASLIPPALPRLPAATCALTTEGPSAAAAALASAGLAQSTLRGTAMPAGVSTLALPTCSSKSIAASAPVPGPVVAEQLFLARLVLRDGGDQVGDVQEMAVIEVLGDAVTAPGAATHAQREIEPVVEAAAIAECVRLVDENAHHVGGLGDTAPAAHVARMQPAGVATTLVREDLLHSLHGRLEVAGPIHGEHQRQLLL